MNAPRILVLALLCLLLAGCTVRFAYNNLDWLVMRWVNQQISLNDEQDRALREELAGLIVWHCTEELPRYTEDLLKLNRELAEPGFDANRLADFGLKLNEHGTRLTDRATPAFVNLMASLDDQQVLELVETLEDSNQDFIDDYVDIEPDELKRKQVQIMERGLRRFIGRVNGDQRERLFEWAASLEPSSEQTLDQRLAWQSRLIAALGVRDDEQAFAQAMEGVLGSEADWPEDYQALMMRNRVRSYELMVDLYALASDRQRQRLHNRLDRFARDFERLTCEPVELP
ncbi:MAG: DUF6279 family lipoprotein [Wenzhouxiangella sp.]